MNSSQRGWLRQRRHTNSTSFNINSRKVIVRCFPYQTLQIATNNFSTVIGRGGYGSVSKGILPDDGRPIAVKRLYKPDPDGFLERMEFMSHLQHINLIQLIGCCVENDEQLIVYEFAQNGTVWHNLHSARRSVLNWDKRAAICIGTARGLSYLHEEINPQLIHRDINPSNILLDANFVPKISDFDLADFDYCFDKSAIGGGPGAGATNARRIGVGDPGTEDSLTNTTIKGTMGYLDPDYFVRGKCTEKVDVYSFGLTMLEIITGRKAVDLALKDTDDRMILNWVTRMKKDDMVLELVDPILNDFPKEEAERFINVALLCAQANSEQRPSMFEVVMMLYGRYKSDQEISDIAMRAATEIVQWSSGNSIQNPVSMYSFTDGFSGEADIINDSTSIGVNHEAEVKTRGEVNETPSSSHNSIIPIRNNAAKSKGSKGKCALEPLETRPSSSGTEEHSFMVTDVSIYFHKSMEKIMKSQAAISGARNRTARTTQSVVIKKYSEQVYMEAVYPPFQSGEYRRSRSIV